MSEEDFSEEKTGRARKNSILIFLSLIVIISIYLFFSSFGFSPSQKVFCGDGTIFDTCSLNKPYYCDSGKLIYSPSLCKCPEVLENKENQCVDDSFGEFESMDFKYILDGDVYYLTASIPTNFSNYLDTLSREIIYFGDEVPNRGDFKLMKMDNPLQREAIIPLVVAIQNAAPNSVDKQAKIAASIVQNIPYGEPDFETTRFGAKIRLSRYPYEVLDQYVGSCEGKSELLSFILRELGFGVSIFYYPLHSHEAVGIACPVEYSLEESGYCFIETTVPAPISYSSGVYLGVSGGRLTGSPEIILLSKGNSLGNNLDDYSDAKKLNWARGNGKINIFQKWVLDYLRKKYGLTY